MFGQLILQLTTALQFAISFSLLYFLLYFINYDSRFLIYNSIHWQSKKCWKCL